MLARRDDLKVVRRHADLTREVVRPLMAKSFTRRVTVFAYELFSSHPPLPKDLGARPDPLYEKVDPGRLVPDPQPGFAGGGASTTILRDLETRDLCMFKDRDEINLTLATQAIDALSQPLRAAAATVVAAVLGVETPAVRLVEYAGRLGSLQTIVTGTRDLSKLSEKSPDLFRSLIRTEEFAQQRSDIWVLDRLIGNLDRQSHNILVRLLEKGFELIPIDHDLTFPPVRRVRPLLGVRPYKPRRVRRETYERLKQLAADPSALREGLAPLLTEPEIEAVVVRLTDTIQIIDNTIAKRGEAKVFF